MPPNVHRRNHNDSSLWTVDSTLEKHLPNLVEVQTLQNPPAMSHDSTDKSNTAAVDKSNLCDNLVAVVDLVVRKDPFVGLNIHEHRVGT